MTGDGAVGLDQHPPLAVERRADNPLHHLRLVIAAGVSRENVGRIFDALWTTGAEASDSAAFSRLVEELGADVAKVASPEVKDTLRRNTEAAVARGVFGVPTYEVDGELFWGADSLDFVKAFLADPAVAETLSRSGVPSGENERVLLAQGAPGALLSSGVRETAVSDAHRFLEAAVAGNRAELLKLAFTQGHSGARAGFSDTLDALTLALYQRMKSGAAGPDPGAAGRAGRAIDLVQEARRLAEANVSPQLISARLITDLASVLS